MYAQASKVCTRLAKKEEQVIYVCVCVYVFVFVFVGPDTKYRLCMHNVCIRLSLTSPQEAAVSTRNNQQAKVSYDVYTYSIHIHKLHIHIR